MCDSYKFINKSSVLSRLSLTLFRLLIFYNLIFSKKRENLIYIKKINNLLKHTQFITIIETYTIYNYYRMYRVYRDNILRFVYITC